MSSMLYKLSRGNTEALLKIPESGMGIQYIRAQTKTYENPGKEFLVINGQYAHEVTGFNIKDLNDSLRESIRMKFKNVIQEIHLSAIAELKRTPANVLKEENQSTNLPAKQAKVENANGDELFVRLSAFEDDIRIDKENRCLRAGSFTTTASDVLKCKIEKHDPAQRYALPNELEIKWAFYIEPNSADTLQRGWVQRNFGKRGGGREAYFAKGTSHLTFIAPSPW